MYIGSVTEGKGVLIEIIIVYRARENVYSDT